MRCDGIVTACIKLIKQPLPVDFHNAVINGGLHGVTGIEGIHKAHGVAAGDLSAIANIALDFLFLAL